ncbi:MAG: hypothetical protein GX458_04115 [Phyllobacteriaceae bacterium]|nr:hypothetical protein [Phyllobacteriaceae bacterium]
MTIRTAATAVAFLLAAAAPAAALDCSLAKAVYTPLDADDDWSAEDGVANAWEITHPRRAGTDSDRPWVIRLAETRQKLAAEFGVAHPPGFGMAHVFMLTPPGEKGKHFDAGKAPSAPLYYFGDDLKRVDPEGEDDPKAPPLVQLPGLSKAFWDWKRDGRRFVPPDGLWKLTACRD